MYVSRRDYILRLIEEVAQLLARIVFQRTAGRPQEALQSLVQACERLFGMEADKLFQFTPEQHFAMLVEGEAPETARNKILLYAALNKEAGKIYTQLTHATMAHVSFLNALRLTLKAQHAYSTENLPAFAPRVPELLAALKDRPLDAETAELIHTALSAK